MRQFLPPRRLCINMSGKCLVAATALGFVLAACIGVPQAQAQFVCGGSATGDEPQAGAGAMAGPSPNNVACGTSADASGPGSANTATGSGANASGALAANIATGSGANASGGGSRNIAIGSGATATGGRSSAIAIGSGATATGGGSSAIAIGSGATTTGGGSSAIAIGSGANVTGGGSSAIAIGSGANVTGGGSLGTAIGAFTSASGTGTAVGSGSTATGTNSSAIGNGALATFANSAAFGNGATATSANQQMFGTATNTFTMAGIASAASKAAQSGPVQIVTSDASGNLATGSAASLGFATSADIANINGQLADLNNRTNKANAGVAMAFAFAGVPTLLPTERFAISGNWGIFEGQNGLAFNAAMRISNNVQLNGGVAYGTSQSIAGGRVGVRVGW